MINTKFEAYKIRRELKKSGEQYEFVRAELNEFKEPTNKTVVVGKLMGLYHEQNSNISVTMGDTTQIRTKKIPMILCLFEDVKSLMVHDTVKINSKTFKITGIVNIQEWNVVADISLEAIDNGVST